MTYNAMDIASYIINKSIDMNSPVSNLKLQKLLYYIQAVFLIKKGEPAFGESIAAWKYGPVVENVYYQFRSYVNNEIKDRVLQRNNGVLKGEGEDYNPENIIMKEDQNLIDNVLESYMNFSGTDLIRKTHQEDPWKTIKDRGQVGYSNIENNEIKKYFKQNESRIYGEPN